MRNKYIGYFEFSQGIKKEIEADSDLVNKIKEGFRGKLQPLGEGTSTVVYRIGKLKKNNFVALRLERTPSYLAASIANFELYCQCTEKYADRFRENDTRSVAFCIGIIYDSRIAGVITEDITAGGKYKILNIGDDIIKVQKEGNKIEQILVDSDIFEDILEIKVKKASLKKIGETLESNFDKLRGYSPIYAPEFKYFLKGNRLEL